MNAMDTVENLLLRTGATAVLWLLVGLSFTTVVVMIERWLFLRARGGDLRALAEGLDSRLRAGDLPGALRELAASPAVAASIAAAGLRLAERGPAAAEKAMQSAAALERGRLEDRLAFLGTVGNNAPFVGLFGTVVGVIHAFEELGRGGPGHAGGTAAGQVATQAVMGSIAEALVATAVGILVALPAVAAYNLFQRRVSTLLRGTEVLSNLVLAYLLDTTGSPQAHAPTQAQAKPHAVG
jgi:biopolymer transport protein ExbB